MTLLAHWPFDDGHNNYPTTARDAAAGGSGSHEGTYTLSGTDYNWYGRLTPGGVGGRVVVNQAGSANGTVTAIQNPADLRLLGALTVMAWLHADDYYYWYEPTKVVNVTGIDETEAENDLWALEVAGVGRAVRLRWERSTGVDVAALSTTGLMWLQGWTHVAVERYEVVAGKWGCRFYRDGQLFSTDDNGGAGYDPPTGGGNSLPYIGRDGAGQTTRQFVYDSIRVYDTAIGQASIQAVYDAEKANFDDRPTKDDWAPSGPLSRTEGAGRLYQVIESGPNSTRQNAGWHK